MTSDRAFMVVILVFLLAGAGIMYTALGRLQASLEEDFRLRPPPFEMLTGERLESGVWVITPHEASVCPNDDITWDVRILVTRNAFLEVARWVKNDAGFTLVTAPVARLGIEAGTILEADRTVSTKGLPPGGYYVLNGARGAAITEPFFYRVPFEIRGDC